MEEQIVFKEEKKRLHMTIEKINKQREQLSQISRYYGKDIVEQLLDDQRQKQLQNLKIAYPEPYFGRLDFEADGAKAPVPLYIGKVGVQDSETDQLLVIDWRAPISSMFYSFTGQGNQASYDSPDGLVEGTVHLKRNLSIRKQVLQRVVDSYVRDGDNLGVTDEFLLYRLNENKDNRLRDIVSTIQLEQNKIIRAERNQALVIQGVPGSGKTTVALHRLAYLLYQYQEQIKAEKIVIFAPNTMFLDYISDVLPELGVGGVQQTTFAKWVLEMLEENISLQEPAKRQLGLCNIYKEVLAKEEEIANYKGSIRFMQALESALDQYEATFVPNKSFTAWDGTELSAETIHDWFYNEYKHYPLAKRRDRVFARIKRWIGMEHSHIKARDPKNTLKKQANQRLRTYMKVWPQHKPLELYIHLLTSILPSILELRHASSFQGIPKKKNKEVQFEDLAPLLFIHNKLYGINPEHQFHHVVIDEAQDFSPFQVAVLKEHCQSQSFTILGDLLQNIFAFQGITRWKEFLELFNETRTKYYQLERSYRSTMEIIHFANEIIQKYNDSVPPAKPVFRSGEPIQVFCIEPEHRIPTIEASIKQMLKKGANTVAVITRTEQASREIYKTLSSTELDVHLITSEQSEYQGGISIAPIYLTKGMEFDAVLLVDVDDQHYVDHALNAKLLYVGCTRALHQLHLSYNGNPSPLIKNIDPELYVTNVTK